METIYDHNPTETELINIGANSMSKSEYLSIIASGDDADSANWDLALLFDLRGDVKKTELYANRIKDDAYRTDLWRTLTHP